MDINFQYPLWYLLFCLIFAVIFTGVLYYKDTTFSEQKPILRKSLVALRFLSLFIIAALLLSPFLKSIVTETKKPVVVIAQDQSESIKAGMSEEQIKNYQTNLEGLQAKLTSKYDVKNVSFGSEVNEGINFKFNEKSTNIAKVIKESYDLYNTQNLGAIIVASDGIYNEGTHPMYAAEKNTAPIYTIALGDTIPKKDLVLKKVLSNNIAYLGDKFSIQVDVAAKNCGGQNSNLTVSKVNGKERKAINTFPISISGNDFFTTKEIILNADAVGVQRYLISLSGVNGEATTLNNSKEIFIDVLDARQKIALLYNSPHPDISALNQALSGNKNFQVTATQVNDPNIKISDYDLVVLHQIPAKTGDASVLLRQIMDKKIPHWFILCGQSDITKLASYQSLTTIISNGQSSNDVTGKFSGNFNHFTLNERLLQEISNYPPLVSPFGDYKSGANGQVLFYQKIGKVDTKFPLWTIGEYSGLRQAVLSAEGIWKWRMFDYLQHKSHDQIDELVNKTVQYLTVKEDKRKFRTNVVKNIFKENETIDFTAELYNDNYELINDADVALTVTNQDKKDFVFTFNKQGKSYVLNIGQFPVGEYSYKGSVKQNGTTLTHAGQFSVQPVQQELFETTADHSVLRALSQKYDGITVHANELDKIVNNIEEKGVVKPTIYTTNKTRSVINLKWLFGSLIVLLGLEWFLRRYFGSY